MACPRRASHRGDVLVLQIRQGREAHRSPGRKRIERRGPLAEHVPHFPVFVDSHTDGPWVLTGGRDGIRTDGNQFSPRGGRKQGCHFDEQIRENSKNTENRRPSPDGNDPRGPMVQPPPHRPGGPRGGCCRWRRGRHLALIRGIGVIHGERRDGEHRKRGRVTQATVLCFPCFVKLTCPPTFASSSVAATENTRP